MLVVLQLEAVEEGAAGVVAELNTCSCQTCKSYVVRVTNNKPLRRPPHAGMSNNNRNKKNHDNSKHKLAHTLRSMAQYLIFGHPPRDEKTGLLHHLSKAMNPLEILFIRFIVPSNRQKPDDIAFEEVNQSNVVSNRFTITILSAAQML